MSAVEEECLRLCAADYAIWRMRHGVRLNYLAYLRALGLDL
jgi:hypothetical protein